MIKMAANGVHTLDSGSAGTYHEPVASVVGSASCKVLVRMKRQPNSAWEQATNQHMDTALVAAGILLCTVFAQTGPLYSCVPPGTAIAHVKVG